MSSFAPQITAADAKRDDEMYGETLTISKIPPAKDLEGDYVVSVLAPRQVFPSI
jgi:hypothetical protein